MNLQGAINIFGFGPAAIGMAIVMVLALIGMIVCAKKQDVTPAAKPAAIACMVIIILCAFGILTTTGMFGDAGTKKIIQNEMVYLKASAYIPGKYIGDKFPGSKILLLIDEEANNTRQADMIAEFERGLAGRCEIIGKEIPKPIPLEETEAGQNPTPTPPPPGNEQAPEMVIPIQEIMTAESVIAAISKYPNVTMIVSFIGLPRDFNNMDIWYEEDESKKIKVAIVGGEIYQLGPGIASGQIVAAVTYNPKAKFDESKAPSDPQAAFDKRYILITPENIEKIASENQGLFEVQKE